MPTISTDSLDNWPTAESLTEAGQGLLDKTKSFTDAVGDGQTAWKDLSAPGVCDGDINADALHQAMDPLSTMTDRLTHGAALACAALVTLSSFLETNAKLCADLREQVVEFNKLPQPPTTTQPSDTETQGSEWNTYWDTYNTLKSQVDALRDELDDAVTTCASKIDLITIDGTTSDPGQKRLSDLIIGSSATAAQAFLVNTYKEVTTTITKYSVRLFGHDFKVPLIRGKNVASRVKLSSLFEKVSLADRIDALRNDPTGFRGGEVPKSTVPPRVVEEPAEGKFGIGKTRNVSVKNVPSGWRWGGRGLGAAGIAWTAYSEYNSATQVVATEHPDWTADQQQGAVVEKTVVRTASQVGVAMAAGAAIGSVIPVGGTAVGVVIGLGVGLAMSIQTPDGKSVADHVADLGEGVYNGAKDGVKKAWKSLFG